MVKFLLTVKSTRFKAWFDYNKMYFKKIHFGIYVLREVGKNGGFHFSVDGHCGKNFF